MTPDIRAVRAERRRNRNLQSGFVYQGPFKKDFSIGSQVINEVVLGTRVNKCKRRGRRRRQSNLQQRGARETRHGASGLSLPFLFNAAAALLLRNSPRGRSLSTNCSPRKARSSP